MYLLSKLYAVWITERNFIRSSDESAPLDHDRYHRSMADGLSVIDWLFLLGVMLEWFEIKKQRFKKIFHILIK